MKNQTCNFVAIFAIVLGCQGCGGGSDIPSDRPKTVQVDGVVTYNGTPVPGASITLGTMGEGHGASGKADNDGKFKLTTFQPGDGVVPGEYVIGVVRYDIVGADNSYFDEKSPNYGKTPPPGAEGKKVYIVPEKFADANKSGVRVTVAQDQKELKIELKD